MTLDQYNDAVKHILAEQQSISQLTAHLALTGGANPTNPQFGQLMARQWSLIQQMTKLNTDMMLGIMAHKV